MEIKQSITIDYERMSQPDWRSVQSRHQEQLAARLVTRGDLLRLVAETDRELTAGNLVSVARLGHGDHLDGMKIAQAMLKPTGNLGEPLRLSISQKALIVDCFAPIGWRIG